MLHVLKSKVFFVSMVKLLKQSYAHFVHIPIIKKEAAVMNKI